MAEKEDKNEVKKSKPMSDALISEQLDDLMEDEDEEIEVKTNAAPMDIGRKKSSNLDVSSLIKAQSFNGSYSFSTLHTLIPALSTSDIKANLPTGVTGKSETLEAIFVTAIICIYFANVFGNQKTLWELVVKKSKNWIKKESEASGISTDWDAAAQKLLSTHGF